MEYYKSITNYRKGELLSLFLTGCERLYYTFDTLNCNARCKASKSDFVEYDNIVVDNTYSIIYNVNKTFGYWNIEKITSNGIENITLFRIYCQSKSGYVCLIEIRLENKNTPLTIVGFSFEHNCDNEYRNGDISTIDETLAHLADYYYELKALANNFIEEATRIYDYLTSVNEQERNAEKWTCGYCDKKFNRKRMTLKTYNSKPTCTHCYDIICKATT